MLDTGIFCVENHVPTLGIFSKGISARKIESDGRKNPFVAIGESNFNPNISLNDETRCTTSTKILHTGVCISIIIFRNIVQKACCSSSNKTT